MADKLNLSEDEITKLLAVPGPVMSSPAQASTIAPQPILSLGASRKRAAELARLDPAILQKIEAFGEGGVEGLTFGLGPQAAGLGGYLADVAQNVLPEQREGYETAKAEYIAEHEAKKARAPGYGTAGRVVGTLTGALGIPGANIGRPVVGATQAARLAGAGAPVALRSITPEIAATAPGLGQQILRGIAPGAAVSSLYAGGLAENPEDILPSMARAAPVGAALGLAAPLAAAGLSGAAKVIPKIPGELRAARELLRQAAPTIQAPSEILRRLQFGQGLEASMAPTTGAAREAIAGAKATSAATRELRAEALPRAGTAEAEAELARKIEQLGETTGLTGDVNAAIESMRQASEAMSASVKKAAWEKTGFRLHHAMLRARETPPEELAALRRQFGNRVAPAAVPPANLARPEEIAQWFASQEAARLRPPHPVIDLVGQEIKKAVVAARAEGPEALENLRRGLRISPATISRIGEEIPPVTPVAIPAPSPAPFVLENPSLSDIQEALGMAGAKPVAGQAQAIARSTAGRSAAKSMTGQQIEAAVRTARAKGPEALERLRKSLGISPGTISSLGR